MSTVCDGQSAWDCCHGNRAKGTREREINKQTNKQRERPHRNAEPPLPLHSTERVRVCVCECVHSNHSSAALMCKYSLNMLDGDGFLVFPTSAGKNRLYGRPLVTKIC